MSLMTRSDRQTNTSRWFSMVAVAGTLAWLLSRGSRTENSSKSSAKSEITTFMLATFAELYRQEVGVEEDFYRALPFFGTALGVIVAAVVYSASHLSSWFYLSTTSEYGVFIAAAALLLLTMIEALRVVFLLARGVGPHPYGRIGPERPLHDRLNELRAYYEAQGITGEKQDDELVKDMQQVLLESYMAATPVSRAVNQRRFKLRAQAAGGSMRSLLWALLATILIFAADELGYIPKVIFLSTDRCTVRRDPKSLRGLSPTRRGLGVS
jgi:hypothetical protein